MDMVQRLSQIRGRVDAACARVGRDPASVRLLAVSKGHPPEVVRSACDAGLAMFGENKVQEAKAKIPLCPGRLEWHMIGHLQSNKVRDAMAFFHTIQSVDSLSLAVELNKAAEKAAKVARIFLEVNVAGESTKFGYSPEAIFADLEALNQLPRLEIHGIMGMAPWTPDATRVRAAFRRLREIRDQCCSHLGVPSMELSMGMSGDFETAIEEGSTLIRLGTAIFGPRRFARPVAD